MGQHGPYPWSNHQLLPTPLQWTTQAGDGSHPSQGVRPRGLLVTLPLPEDEANQKAHGLSGVTGKGAVIYQLTVGFPWDTCILAE